MRRSRGLERARARKSAIKIHHFAFAVHKKRCDVCVVHIRSVTIILCSSFSPLCMLVVLMNDLATIIHHFFVCFYTPDDHDDVVVVVADDRSFARKKRKNT